MIPWSPGQRGVVTCGGCGGTLVVNEISLHEEPAWCCWDVFPLWFEETLKGSGLVEAPDADGAWPYRQLRGAHRLTLPIAISGYYDKDGEAYADEWVGLQTNVEYLKANVFDMRDSGTPVASWDATLTLPDASERTAEVKVGNLRIGKRVQGVFLCSFDLTIIPGVFSA